MANNKQAYMPKTDARNSQTVRRPQAQASARSQHRSALCNRRQRTYNTTLKTIAVGLRQKTMQWRTGLRLRRRLRVKVLKLRHGLPDDCWRPQSNCNNDNPFDVNELNKAPPPCGTAVAVVDAVGVRLAVATG